MGSIRPIRPPLVRPSGNPSINWAHPLALKMVDCLLWTSLVPANLASPTVKTALTNTPTLSPTVIGYSGYVTGGSSFNIPDHVEYAAADFAIRVLFRPISWNVGGFTVLFDNSARSLSMFFDVNGNISFSGIGAGSPLSSGATAMTAGKVWDFVLTRNGSTASVYVNGVFITSATSNSVGTNGGPLNFGGNPSTGGSTADAQYISTQIWVSKGLSAGEVLQLYRDPFCFLTYPQDRSIIGVAAAGGSFIPAWAMNSNLPVLGTGTY